MGMGRSGMKSDVKVTASLNYLGKKKLATSMENHLSLFMEVWLNPIKDRWQRKFSELPWSVTPQDSLNVQEETSVFFHTNTPF